jgi:hypothetical protein
MTKQEFESYTRGIATPVVEFRRGEIDGDKLFQRLYAVLGKETFEATEKLLDEAKNK